MDELIWIEKKKTNNEDKLVWQNIKLMNLNIKKIRYIGIFNRIYSY